MLNLTSLGRLTAVGLWQCEESNTIQSVTHEMCTTQTVSTRSLGHYAYVGYRTNKFMLPVMPLAVPVTETVLVM